MGYALEREQQHKRKHVAQTVGVEDPVQESRWKLRSAMVIAIKDRIVCGLTGQSLQFAKERKINGTVSATSKFLQRMEGMVALVHSIEPNNVMGNHQNQLLVSQVLGAAGIHAV